jgi:lysozyme family protein
MSLFPKILTETLHHEGLWSDHRDDPGGATMKGVTLKTYSDFLGRPATKDELRKIPDDHLLAIYRKGYWDKVKGDELAAISPGLAACVFDFAVNSGPGRAAKALQSLCGAVTDGAIGANTLKQVKVAPGPALAGVVLEADPDQIGFWPIIDDQVRPGVTLWRDHWYRRI